MKNHFSLKGKKEKGKITRQTLNNFTIIKSITIILMYVSQLKKKIYIYIFFFFLFYCHTHKLSFLKGNNPFSLLFLLCGTHLFFTVRHLLFPLLVVFCSLAHHTHAFYIFNSATSHS